MWFPSVAPCLRFISCLPLNFVVPESSETNLRSCLRLKGFIPKFSLDLRSEKVIEVSGLGCERTVFSQSTISTGAAYFPSVLYRLGLALELIG